MFESNILKVAMGGEGVISRRSILRGIGLGAAGLSFPELMAARADELRKRQMACILLWMGGGPSQLETWDPKPGTDHGGDTRAIETAVPGIQIAHHLPRMASVMKDVAILRSMTNKEGNHQRATYQVRTGYAPSGTVKHPGFGSVAAAELGDPSFDLPHIVSIGTREVNVGAGILGVKYEPFLVPDPLKPPLNVQLPVPAGRFVRRLNLMHSLEVGGFGNSGGLDRVREHHDIYKQTSAMILSPHMKAFEVDAEDPKTRALYGATPFGQGCLLARRLVQAGVTFVEVSSPTRWDHHKEISDSVAKNASSVDPGFAALVTDLKARGMLDRTLVVWMGEFGRTPKINPNAGRDHYPRVFSVALAGGGVKGGQVIGASTPDGSAVQDRPITIPDLMSSFCQALKIDPKKENMSPQGRPIKIVDGGSPIRELFA
ncbi:DUF1501 domain-containing protein [Tundrisphaera lichenicola]|uniref:DUF1501 domain-containing protein n=1 Tax=Tundrisphaera lichenicola TaxID=2029860 RepID=UPI003EBD7754